MSHGLASVTIKNYCSCKDVELPLTGYTPLVGYNNAGKSNVIEAIFWLLKKSTLDASKFNDIDQPVIVEAVVNGINVDLLNLLAPNHRASIEPHVVNEQVRVRRKQPSPSCPAGQVVFEVRDSQIEDENADNAWGRPGGIENAIKELFPDPITIKAMEDAGSDVSKFGKSNTIGRLISEVIQPIEDAHGAELREALSSVGNKLAFDGDERANELDTFDQNATDKLASLFPGLRLKLHIPTPQIDEIFKNGTIKVFEDGHGELPKDFSSLGHGAQRSIQMALVRQLAEIRQGVAPESKTTLLLIDEPELFLHPQAIESVRAALKRLTTEGFQVIFSTHSAQMIPSEDVSKTLIVHKSVDAGTKVRQRIDEAVSVIEDAGSQADVLFSLTNSNQVLFSETVLLSEGKTERKLLPKIFEKINGSTIGESKIALVEQQGVGNTAKSLQVLSALDIPAKALVDLDFAFRGAIESDLIQADDEDIVACKLCLANIADAEGIILCERGLPKRQGRLNASQSFAKMAEQADVAANIQSLHQKLLQMNVWLWTKGAIEDHLGNEAKNERHLSRFAQRIEQENIQDLLEDYDTVNRFCEWLVE